MIESDEEIAPVHDTIVMAKSATLSEKKTQP
jgi:hypothetical protein